MSDEPKAACFNLKGFTSFVLLIAFLVMALSGILLYVGPPGPFAKNWTFLGLGKGGWNHLHMTTATLFLIAAVFHLAWNWSMFWGYLKKKAQSGLNLKIELVLALVVGAVVVAGTIYNVPPFSSIVELKRSIGSSWAGGKMSPPGEHGQGGGHGPGEGQGMQHRGGHPVGGHEEPGSGQQR